MTKEDGRLIVSPKRDRKRAVSLLTAVGYQPKHIQIDTEVTSWLRRERRKKRSWIGLAMVWRERKKDGNDGSSLASLEAALPTTMPMVQVGLESYL